MGKADVNAINRFGATPLSEPVMAGRKDCVDLLVQNGAKMNVTDNDGVNLMQLSSALPFLSSKHEMMSEAMSIHAKSEKKAAKAQGLYHVCANCKNTKDTKRCSKCYMK